VLSGSADLTLTADGNLSTRGYISSPSSIFSNVGSNYATLTAVSSPSVSLTQTGTGSAFYWMGVNGGTQQAYSILQGAASNPNALGTSTGDWSLYTTVGSMILGTQSTPRLNLAINGDATLMTVNSTFSAPNINASTSTGVNGSLAGRTLTLNGINPSISMSSNAGTSVPMGINLLGGAGAPIIYFQLQTSTRTFVIGQQNTSVSGLFNGMALGDVLISNSGANAMYFATNGVIRLVIASTGLFTSTGSIVTNGSLYVSGLVDRAAVGRVVVSSVAPAGGVATIVPVATQGFILVQDSATFCAIYCLRAADVILMSFDTAGRWSHTAGTASATNIYKSGGSVFIQNNTATTNTYYVQLLNWA
jgi:hypothetical protein